MSLSAILSRLVSGVALLAFSFTLAQANAVELKGSPVPLGDANAAAQTSSNSAAPRAAEAPEPPEVPETGAVDLSARAPQLLVTADGKQISLDDHEIQISDEQLEALWTEHIGPEIGRALQGMDIDKETMSKAVLVPLITFFFIFGCPTLIVIALLVLRHRAKGRHLQNLNANIDKLLANGRDIPLELLRGDDPKGAEDNSGLNKGIMNIGLGLGLLIFLTLISGFDVGALSFILIGMGVSRIIIWKLSQQKPTEQEFQG